MMSSVTSSEHSPLLAHYDAGLAYDELLDRQRRPRSHYQAIYDRLLSLPADELNRRKSAADMSFLNQGITFTVYSSSEGTERIFPLNSLPDHVAPLGALMWTCIAALRRLAMRLW